ncbi:sialidase-3-like [Antedon mediterranea]|uniref:sialidase-3-like n=1 Tax=Antedon mediterranea TaxID=105859 RepID=UPI003AF94BA4
MGGSTSKETVFKSSYWSTPTYRIPALVFQEDHFLAFSEKRLTGSKDYGPMKMVVKRRLFKGDNVNWSPETSIYPATETGKRPMNPVPIVINETNVILLFNTYPENMPQSDVRNSDTRVWNLLITQSHDGGETWEPSRELPVDKIFSNFKSGVPSYCAVGPGHAIKLDSGKLIVSGNVGWPKSKNTKSKPFVIISENNGETWHMGGLIPLPEIDGKKISGGECQPVDMGSDNVVINCRTGGTYPRFQCYSSDACKTFSDSQVMQTLIEPKNGCQGSTIGFKATDSKLPEDPEMKDLRWALFSNPDCRLLRRNLSVRLSKDKCQTWSDPPIKVLETLGSAYSDLAAFVEDGEQTFACLFERNKTLLRNIEFTTFTLDD